MGEANTATLRSHLHYGKPLLLGLYLFVTASYIVNGMDRQIFSNLVTYVEEDLNFSKAQGGFLTTVFAIGFGLTGIVAGMLLDRYRRKTVLIGGMILYSVFTILMPLAHGFWDLAAYRVISGVGEGLQQTTIFTIVGVIFAKRRNLALGGVNAAYGVGSFLGPILGIQLYLFGGDNWHLPLYVFGLIGLIYAGLMLFFFPSAFSEFGKAEQDELRRREAEERAVAAAAENAEAPPGKFSWVNRNLVLIASANILLGVVNYSYLGLYPSFLKDSLGYSATAAALCASMYGIGAFGGIIGGYLADKFGERRLIVFAICSSLIVGMLMFNVAEAQWQQIILSLLFGLLNSGFLFVNVYALTQRVVDIRHIGKASGVASSAHYIGAGFSGAIFGALVDGFGWGFGSMVVIVIVPMIAAVAVLCIRLSAKPLSPVIH